MALEHCWFRCCPLGPPGITAIWTMDGAHLDGFKIVDSMGNLHEFTLVNSLVDPEKKTHFLVETSLSTHFLPGPMLIYWRVMMISWR